MKKEKTIEAILVISTGLLLLYLIYERNYLLYIAFTVGLIGIVINPLASLIANGWYKLGDILGFVVSKVVLALMFYILMTPIAFLYNIFNKDALRLKKSDDSFWTSRNHDYAADDLKNIW